MLGILFKKESDEHRHRHRHDVYVRIKNRELDLELDWACVTWDEDFRYSPNGWQCYSFVGSRWNNINKAERKIAFKKCLSGFINKSTARNGDCCSQLNTSN
jgi:hypothetical protein